MAEVLGGLATDVGDGTRHYGWRWQGREVSIAYDVRGKGQTLLLLLPAFSSISTRAELGGLAMELAQGYRVITLDWLGFGGSARPPWRSRPATVPGSLAAYEEHPEAVLESLRPFRNCSTGLTDADD